jgi:hypothetical protein
VAYVLTLVAVDLSASETVRPGAENTGFSFRFSFAHLLHLARGGVDFG